MERLTMRRLGRWVGRSPYFTWQLWFVLVPVVFVAMMVIEHTGWPSILTSPRPPTTAAALTETISGPLTDGGRATVTIKKGLTGQARLDAIQEKLNGVEGTDYTRITRSAAPSQSRVNSDEVTYDLQVWKPVLIVPKGRRTTNYDAAGNVVGYSETEAPEAYYSMTDGEWQTLDAYMGPSGRGRDSAFSMCHAEIKKDWVQENVQLDDSLLSRVRRHTWVRCVRESSR